MKKGNKLGLKQFLLIPAMLFVISLATGQLQAEGGLKLVAGEEEGAGGEQVSVIIMVENAAGSEGGQFILNYDPALVRPVSSETGELVVEASSGMQMVNLEYAEGQMMVMWVTAAADAADEGVICTIEFELLNEGETILEFADLIISPEGLEPATPVSGKITVGDTEVGQEEIDEDQLDSEDEAAVEEGQPSVNEIEESEDEETVVSAVEQANKNILFAVLVGLAVLGAAGFMIFKRPKKGKH